MSKPLNRIWSVSGGVVGFVVVVCIAIAVNVILGNMSFRKDLTEEKLYELSGGTREVLKGLEERVTLKFFFSSSSAEVPMQLKSFAQRVEDLLREYELASKGMITIQKFDPKPDSDAEEWAQKYGVAGQSLGFMGPTLFMGLVVSSGETDDVIPFVDPRTENLLEYNLTRMIARVSNPKKPVIGVISSLPVMGDRRPPYPMPNMPPPSPAWFAFRDLKKDYDVREIQTPAAEIEPDVDTLIVVHPRDLKDQTLFAIDQFVLRGGRLMVFLDPFSIVQAETQPAMPQMRFQPKSSDMPKLLEAWGVKYESAKLVADQGSASRIRGAGGKVEDSLVWLSLRKGGLNAEDILTARIESVMMPFAGAFEAEDTDDVKVTSLIASSEASALMDAMSAQFGGDSLRRQFKSGMKKLDLAIRLHGKFKTAFPGGAPPPPPPDPQKGAPPPPPPPSGMGLKESEKPSTIVLVGDADMLYDRFCVQEISLFGSNAYAPMNDNLALFGNTIEQMAGSTALVSIRTRGKTARPFDVVLDLQKDAQERYLQEEMRLQKKLEDVQQRLSQLQTKKDDKQRYFLSPQQQKEIEDFRAQSIKTKKELKLVRRKLREDIEHLGVWVKVINILLMPLLVALAGVAFWIYRRVKT